MFFWWLENSEAERDEKFFTLSYYTSSDGYFMLKNPACLTQALVLLQFNLHASKKVGRSPKLRIREVVVALLYLLLNSRENSKSIWQKKN